MDTKDPSFLSKNIEKKKSNFARDLHLVIIFLV